MSPRSGKLSIVTKRDYGQTTSALLSSQQHRYERKLQECKDKNFELAGRLAREQELRARYESFLDEKGLLNQWQTEA